MKPKTPRSRVGRLILEEASEWFVEFRVGDVDAQAREAFDEWLRRSPEHIRAYMEIAKTYVELPALQSAGQIDVDGLIAYAHSGENVVPFDRGSAASTNEPPAPLVPPNYGDMGLKRAGQSPRTRYQFLAAASCALVFVIVGALWWRSERYPTYNTDIGERRSITLADGSTVDLNARSQIRIEFSSGERHVELLDGQALFQVAKDKNRPFTVRSGDATVRAVGTEFDVYRKASGTTVTVLEGRVAVYSNVHGHAATPMQEANPTAASSHSVAQTPLPVRTAAAPVSSSRAPYSDPQIPSASGLADPSGPPGVLLSAGEQVTVTPRRGLPAPAHADVAAATAWTERRLIFEGARLSDVVQEFNRYNRRQLVLEGTQLSDFHVSGVFSSTDPTALIRFLRAQPRMKLTENDTEIRITGQ
jgi:transmembrane sensor